MATPEGNKKSRRPVPTRYDEDEHALHIKTGQGRGRPFKVSLDSFVPRRVAGEQNRTGSQTAASDPQPSSTGGWMKKAIGAVAGLGVGWMVVAFCKGAIEEGGGQVAKHYWPQIFGAEESAPPRRRSR